MSIKQIAVLTSSTSWFIPYARKLVKKLTQKKHFAKLFLDHANIPKSYDIVFALAIVKWIGGYAPWIASLVKPGGVAYFESHGPQAEEFPLEQLQRDFKTVELLGETKDLGTRKVWRCEK